MTGRRSKPKSLPYDEEAEESVVGAVMLAPDTLADVAELVRPEDFHGSKPRTIYEAVLARYGRGDPIDAVTVVDELRKQGRLEDAGGHIYVHHLVESVPTPASAAHYARIVADNARLRGVLTAAHDIAELVYAGGDSREIVERAEARILSVSATRLDATAPVRMATLVSEALDDLEGDPEGIVWSGFRDLDKLLGGFRPGALYMIAARPGVGKSAFVGNVARNASVEYGAPVALFSLEMSRHEIAMRLLCAEARVPWERVRDGKLADAEWTRFTRAAEAFGQTPLWVIDSPSMSVVDIRARARRMQHAHGLGMVIVDYLQLMPAHVRSDSRRLEVEEISRGLKLLAKELEVPVVAVSQLNREAEKRRDHRPQLSDLRESGSLEQDSDVVMFLQRREDRETEARLIVAKHRNGRTGTVPLTFLPDVTQFADYAPGRDG